MPSSDQQVDTLLAMLSKHEHKAQDCQYRECGKLKVLTAVQKMIPGPNSFRQGHGNQRNSDRHQQKATDPRIYSRRTCECSGV